MLDKTVTGVHYLAFDEITEYLSYLSQCEFQTVTKYELGFIATMANGLRIVAYVKDGEVAHA